MAWHLRDRWWAPPRECDFHKVEGDRTYCRGCCPDQRVSDLLRDCISGLWKFDGAHV